MSHLFDVGFLDIRQFLIEGRLLALLLLARLAVVILIVNGSDFVGFSGSPALSSQIFSLKILLIINLRT